MSISESSTIWQIASVPAYTLIGRSARASFSWAYFVSLAITTASGLNFRAWAMSSSTRLLAVSTYASYWSDCSSITCNACVPMEPVEPSIAICFFIYLSLKIQYIVPDSPPVLCAITQSAGEDRLSVVRCFLPKQ